MKQSKVKNVQANGTWDSPHGILYKFEYEMEDGTILTAQHKDENGNFNPGDLVEYEVKGTNSYGSYGKVSKPQEQTSTYNGTKSSSDAILYQVCLKGVFDFMIANGSPTQFTADGVNEMALDFAKAAKENITKM